MVGAKIRASREELRIGGIFSLSGYLSWSGKYKRKAAELKVEMINEAGGINERPLRLISYDDQSLAGQASRIAETLVCRHRVAAIVGTGSLPISREVARVANRFRTPAFVNSGYAIDPATDLFVFNTAHKTEFAIACSFQYFIEKGINRLALLMPEGPLGDLGSWLANRLGSRMGIRIVGEERFCVTAPEVVPQLTRLRSLKPLALFSFVTGQPAASVVEAMAGLGLDIPLLVSHGNANPRFLKLISHTSVNLIVPSGKTMALGTMLEDDPCRRVVMDFNSRHLLKYGEPAGYYSAELADAIDLFAEGVRLTGSSDTEKLREAVEGIKGFRGMQGNYDMSPIDHYGTGIEQIVLLTVRNGEWHFAKTFCSLDLFEDFHGSRKSRLIGRLAELLPGTETDTADDSVDGASEARALSAARTGLNCTNLSPDLHFAGKLFCQQKMKMVKSIREREFGPAKEALSRLLTVSILHDYDTPETFKLAVLELFLALFDAALDEGVAVDEIVHLRYRLILEWETAKDPETLCLWVIRAIDSVGESLSCKGGRKGADLLDRLLRFVETHLSERLSAQRIAREFGLSKSRLMHRMRSECNLSVGGCITRVRIEASKRLLRNTADSISTIALEVGFREQGYFTRVFKRSVGETPQSYRKRAAGLSLPQTTGLPAAPAHSPDLP